MKFIFVCRPDELENKIEEIKKRFEGKMLYESHKTMPANQDPGFISVEIKFGEQEKTILHD